MRTQTLPLRAVALGAVLALALLYWLHAALAPDSLGVWQDDAIYVSTAQALAEGQGYRHIELPDAPLQTKYPVLYPALLAPLVAIGGGRSAAVFLPTALGAALLVALCGLYQRRVFGESPRAALTLCALSAVSPALVDFVRYAMSELVYAPLAVGALLYLDTDAPDEANARRRQIAAGVLVGLALLTRSIGVSLLLAAVALPLWRRRPAQAACIGGAACLVALPWWMWVGWAARTSGALPAELEAPELGYGLWFPHALADVLRVALQNALRGTLILGYESGLPASFVRGGLVEAGAPRVALHLACCALVALLAWGFVASARRGLRTLHVYALAYTGMTLAWPFTPDRFLLPWIPFALYFQWLGLRDLVDRLSLPPALAARASTALALVTALFFTTADVRIVASTPERFSLNAPIDFDVSEVDALAEWLELNTRVNDTLAAAWPAGLFLRTGRRGYFLWPDTDPYVLYFGTDREASMFYTSGAPSEERYLISDLRQRLVSVYRQAGVDYVVDFGPGRREAELVARVVRMSSGSFELRYESPRRTARVYRVRSGAEVPSGG